MHEVTVSTAYRDAVKAHPACASLVQVLQWRVPEMKEAAVYPAVTFSARDVVPIGVDAYCTANVEVRLEAESDDETDDSTQAARANLIMVALLDMDALNTAMNTASPRLIRSSGYALAGGGRGTSGRRWTSSTILRVGFAPMPPQL